MTTPTKDKDNDNGNDNGDDNNGFFFYVAWIICDNLVPWSLDESSSSGRQVDLRKSSDYIWYQMSTRRFQLALKHYLRGRVLTTCDR